MALERMPCYIPLAFHLPTTPELEPEAHRNLKSCIKGETTSEELLFMSGPVARKSGD